MPNVLCPPLTRAKKNPSKPEVSFPVCALIARSTPHKKQIMPFSKEFFIIDAHGFLHRNYHALPKLRTSKGEEAGALYGFVNWLVRFLKDKKPRYAAVCFDSKGPTFRHELYADYKANRPKADEELVSQLKIARDLVSAMGLKTTALPGAEADDLMATLAVLGKKSGKEVVIVTSDKDIFQAAGGGVKIWSGAAKEGYKSDEACLAKFNVPCAYMRDYLAIVGDSSDNVPGAEGIGPKTAAELINKFGHVEAVYKAAEAGDPSIKPGVIKKLLAAKESVLLSQKLVALKDDLPLGLGIEDFSVNPPLPQELEIFARRFEFKNLIAFLDSFKKAEPVARPQTPVQGELFDFSDEEKPAADPEAVKTDEEYKFASFEEVLKRALISKELFVYAEEDALVLASSGQCAAFADALNLGPEREDALFNLFDDDSILKIGHDVKYTFRVLGYEPKAGKFLNCFDGALAKYCLDPSGEFSLLGCITVNLGVMLAVGAGLKERMAFYAQNIWALKEKLETLLKEKDAFKVYAETEIPLMSVLLNMENNGIMVNTAWLKTLSILLDKEMQSWQKEINQTAGYDVNINSTKQLGVLLFEQLGLPSARKTKTGYSTDEESLETLKKIHPIAEQILKYRESAKLKSTYVDTLLNLAGPETHRVHTNFNQTGTVTGRLSSFSPNLQNIPVRSEKGRLIRQAFVAPEGKVLLSVDYSQIDLRVLAHESGDEALINAFKAAADIHRQTAAEVFNVKPEDVTKEMRSGAKAINFGIVYGQGPLALSQSLGISMSEAKNYIEAYFKRYATVKSWINETAERARKSGYVKTLFGHVRYIPEFEASSSRLTSFANRAAVNTVVQGGSSDIIKKAMTDIFAAPEAEGRLLLLQVHDELIFEVPEGRIKETARWVKEKMENAVKLRVPLLAEAKAGRNWNEMGKVI